MKWFVAALVVLAAAPVQAAPWDNVLGKTMIFVMPDTGSGLGPYPIHAYFSTDQVLFRYAPSIGKKGLVIDLVNGTGNYWGRDAKLKLEHGDTWLNYRISIPSDWVEERIEFGEPCSVIYKSSTESKPSTSLSCTIVDGRQ